MVSDVVPSDLPQLTTVEPDLGVPAMLEVLRDKASGWITKVILFMSGHLLQPRNQALQREDICRRFPFRIVKHSILHSVDGGLAVSRCERAAHIFSIACSGNASWLVQPAQVT